MQKPANSTANRAALVLYVAIFLDLFGFGMIFPDIQLRAEKMGAPGWLIGAMLASTFLVQLIASPQWGKISDRIGRKPVLLACQCLSATGLYVYGFATAIPLLILSRVVSGLGGANVAAGQALLADMTDNAQRTTVMGRMGAAVSLGLIAGPVAGGYIGHISGRSLGLAAGTCSGIGALLILLLVNERRNRGEQAEGAKASSAVSLLRGPSPLRTLVLVVTVAWFSLATLEGTFGRLIEHTLGYDQRQFGIVFGYESLLGFVVQGFLLAWIAKRIKDERLLRMAYLLQGLGLTLTPFTYLFPIPAAWLAVLLGISTIYALGSGLANPTINSLCSKLTPADRQGELFGLLQGARSVGFIVGPILGGALFDRWFAAPYLLAGATCVVAAFLMPFDGVDRTT